MLRALVVQSEAEGVKADAVLLRDYVSPESAILRAAGKIASGLVAIVSQKSELESSLLGSVTRKIIRKSPLPVWVVHVDTTPGVYPDDQ